MQHSRYGLVPKHQSHCSQWRTAGGLPDKRRALRMLISATKSAKSDRTFAPHEMTLRAQAV
jgi:hypothetical protein